MEDGSIKPLRVHTVLVSTQHDENVKNEEIESTVIEKIIKNVIPKEYLNNETRYVINPSKMFTKGGPFADSGLTGRKIIVDTYGGFASHGGGCFSGKDPTKVDRSAAYYARWVAKSLVHNKLCDRVEIQVSYGIGIAEPLSIFVECYGSGKKYGQDNDSLLEIIKKNFDFRP